MDELQICTPPDPWEFFLKFLADTHVLWGGGHLYPCFYISGDVSSGVQSQSGFYLIHFFAEANVMYIPQDPPLVLHLLTSWQLVRSRSCPYILLQRWGCQDSNSCSQNICEPDALPTELNSRVGVSWYIWAIRASKSLTSCSSGLSRKFSLLEVLVSVVYPGTS